MSGILKSATAIPFIVDQTITAGQVVVSDDATGIHITATLNAGWEFVENHIYVGPTVPSTHAPGQFPYSGIITGPGTVEFSIPFSDLGVINGDIYIAFQAQVTDGSGTDDGWAIPDPGALHWYNNGGNPIGWGAYFVYSIAAAPVNLDITVTTVALDQTYAKVRFRNLRENGSGAEVNAWPNDGTSELFSLDFQTTFPFGNYYLTPAKNHITLTYVPNADGTNGFLYVKIEANGTYWIPIITTSTTAFDAIQFLIYNDNEGIDRIYLSNLFINGNAIGTIYEGRDSSPRWNITGDLLMPVGMSIFEADIEIWDQAGAEEDHFIDISFGKM